MSDSTVGSGLIATGLGVRIGGATLLNNVTFGAPRGSWTTLIGPNGAGKSTALRCVAGLQRHTGQLTWENQPIVQLSNRQRARAVAYVPQHPTIPTGIPVAQYVALGRTAHHGWVVGPGSADAEQVRQALTDLDLNHLAERSVHTLSGGEQQRVVLARVLAQDPALVVLDEPTAALDLGHAQQVGDLIDHLRSTRGLTVLSAIHDVQLAAHYAKHLVLLADGIVVAYGAPAQVLTEQHLTTYYQARVQAEPTAHGVSVQLVRASTRTG